MKRSLTRRERLTGKTSFDKVFKTGRQVSVRGAKLVFVRNQLDYSRFAPTLVRKYGNSVVRNRTRRILKENFRLLKSQIKPGFDMVLIAYYVPGKRSEFEERREQMQTLFRKADIFI